MKPGLDRTNYKEIEFTRPEGPDRRQKGQIKKEKHYSWSPTKIIEDKKGSAGDQAGPEWADAGTRKEIGGYSRGSGSRARGAGKDQVEQ